MAQLSNKVAAGLNTIFPGSGTVAQMGSEAAFPKLPELPAIKSPPVMPTPNDDAIRKMRRRSVAEMRQRSGRASTILSDGAAEHLGAN